MSLWLMKMLIENFILANVDVYDACWQQPTLELVSEGGRDWNPEQRANPGLHAQGGGYITEVNSINNKKIQFKSHLTWVLTGESLFQVESCHFTYITQFTPAQEEQVGLSTTNGWQGKSLELWEVKHFNLLLAMLSDDINPTPHPSQKHGRSFWFASDFLPYLSRRIFATLSDLFPHCSAKRTLPRSVRSRLARARSKTPSKSATLHL